MDTKERTELLRMVSSLVKACEAKDDLLVCYRFGKQPSEALFKRLESASSALDGARKLLEKVREVRDGQ